MNLWIALVPFFGNNTVHVLSVRVRKLNKCMKRTKKVFIQIRWSDCFEVWFLAVVFCYQSVMLPLTSHSAQNAQNCEVNKWMSDVYKIISILHVSTSNVIARSFFVVVASLQINIQNISHFLSFRIHFSISTINVCLSVYWMCRHFFLLYSPLVTNRNYRLAEGK